MITHHETLQRLRSFGQALDTEDHRHERQANMPRASVLVGLFEHDVGEHKETHVLLTKRPEHLKSHPGQVCFPGGRQDEVDEGSDVKTALRETMEEVGLSSDRIEPICKWRSIESVNGLCVTPIIAEIKGPLDLENDLELCPREVEAAFVVPLKYFADDANCASAEEIEWKGGTFTMRTFYFTDTSKREFKIWGLTAGIIHHVSICASRGRANKQTK